MKNLKIKSAIIILLSTLALNIYNPGDGNAQQEPTFNLIIKNFVLEDTLGGDDNVLFFDIYIQHTNPGASGQFQLALNQYSFFFNDSIANGGVLSYKIVPGSSQFSNSNAIPRNPKIDVNILNLAINSRLSAGNGPIISSIFPGSRVAKMRLATTAPSFALEPLDLDFFTSENLPFTTRIFAYIGNGNTEITNNATFIIDSVVAVPVSITLAPEGFLNISSNSLNRKDTVRVYLRNNFAPFSIVDSGKTVIDSLTLTGSLIFNNAPSGTYYVSVKHRNSIETWSKSGGEQYDAGWPFNYNFTTAQSQAYGNNLVLKGTKWCIYSGNVNQDGIIDASDLSDVDNDVRNSVSGYVRTDVNGDRYIDGSDLSIVDNNLGVIKITPSGTGPQTLINKLNTKEEMNRNDQEKKQIKQNDQIKKDNMDSKKEGTNKK